MTHHSVPQLLGPDSPTSKTDRWNSARVRGVSRGLLAGPLVFLCAALVMAGGALWIPPGKAGIDNIVLPIVLFPAIWALLFFYAILDRKLLRAWLLVLALLLINAVLIAPPFLHAGAPA